MSRKRMGAFLWMTCLCLTSMGCSTIVGMAVSPITGPVDLVKREAEADQWYFTPVLFIGGIVAGPFLALYAGVLHDIAIFDDWTNYWDTYADTFRPLEHAQTKH